MTVLTYQDFLQTASQKLCDLHSIDQRNAVLIVNLERLAELDGVLGFTIVDEIMHKISRQLQDSLNAGDLVGVTGRYQICCLLVDLLTDAHAMLAAHKILRILTPPVELGRRNIILAARIRVAVNNGSEYALNQLMSNASLAIRQARQEQEHIRLFVADKEDPLRQQIDLWSDLGNAIETCELYLSYQPQINMASGKIESAEALLRWNHPSRGTIPTDKLIQVAEGTELMSRLTLWAFHTALRECSAYQQSWIRCGSFDQFFCG